MEACAILTRTLQDNMYIIGPGWIVILFLWLDLIIRDIGKINLY